MGRAPGAGHPLNTATVVNDGRVLIVGGQGVEGLSNTSELFDE